MPDLNATARLSQQAQKMLGLPEGFATYSPFPFAGMNMQASRIAIADQEFRWRENFIKIGDGNLRTTPDSGTDLYTGTGFPAIIYFFWYYIGPKNYCAVFFNDGTAIQVDGDTGATTTISNATGTFFVVGGSLPACVSWGSQYLLISNNNNFNDYWIWDGTLLYTAGSVGPVINITDIGNSYSSLPTVTAYGGLGSGVVVTPTILNGSILTLQVTAPGTGYVPGDTVQLQFSGGGSDTGAILVADLNSGGVSSVSITNGGSGYGSVPSVTFSAPTGTQATANAILFHGHVAEVVITNPGGGYVTAPAVSFTGGGGSSASGHAIINNGQVVQIVINNQGNGYSTPPTVNIAAPTGAVTATGTATTDGNAVTGVIITNPGSGYTSAPTVSFGGPGTLASAVAFLGSSSVVGVTVVNGGSGYTFPPLISFVGGGDPDTIAEGVTQLAPTSVGHINITSGGGPGYTSAPTVTFNNNQTNGSGAAGTALIANGVVIGVNLTNGGSGYTTPPFITFSGGGLPSGVPQATAQAILKGTSIASVIMSQQGAGYTQAPAVVIAPGSNNAANAIMEMMPFGVSGSGIESYQQRVWISFPKPRILPPITGGVFQVTAPGSLTDFATSDGGLIFKSNSPFLGAAYTRLKQVGDFLYPITDSSVDVISNVQTSGNPPTTTFNYNNTDPQTGTNWRETIRDFSRTALFANATGVYGLYGGAVTKLSEKLDDLFQKAVFPPAGMLTPSAAAAEIYKRKVFLLLMTVQDPFTLSPRNVMVSWDEQDWFITSQVDMPTFINTRVVNGVPTAWGTDGVSIYPLFQNPSSTLKKILQTKLYGAQNFPSIKLAMSLHLMAEDNSGNQGIVMNGILDTENAPYPLTQVLNFGAAPLATPIIAGYSGDIYGTFLGLTLNSTSPDFTLKHLAIGYSLWWGGFGSPPPLGSRL